MQYPERLLPDEKYKLISDGLDGSYLIRSTKTKEDLKNESGEIKIEYICSPSENIQDLSTSLLGVFEPHHSYIELTSEGKQIYADDYCSPNCKVSIPIHKTHFEWDETKGFWFVKIKQIEGQLAEYLISNPPLKAECIVQHTPMKWNFWHFSVRWRFDDGSFYHELPDSERKKDKLRKRLSHEARAIIAKFAFTQEPNFSELTNKHYIQ
jgi:hypothetical protein